MVHWCGTKVSNTWHHLACSVAAKRMAPTASHYGAISHEEVETSLPRYDIFPSQTVEHRRTDSHKDVDGSSHLGV